MEYQRVFSPYTLIRQRLDAIVAGGVDPAPGTTGLAEFDQLIEALASRKPDPFRSMPGSRKVRKPDEYPMVKRVAVAMVELFEIRDGIGFENLKEGEARG
jgi:hypothetical protein